MKKFLCIALSVIMLLGVLPVAAFAVEGDNAKATTTYGCTGIHNNTALDNTKATEGYYFRIGDGTSETTTTYYKNIADAYAALPTGLDTSVANTAPFTVTMINDYEGAGKDPGSKAMIFNGNGYTWTLTSDFLFRWDNADITIKNLSLTYSSNSTSNRSVQFRPNAGTNQQDVIIQNCSFVTENINVDIRGTETKGTYTHTLLVDKCYISTTNGNLNNMNPIYGNNTSTTANWNVTVNDSKLVSCATNTTASSGAVISINNKSNKKFILNLTGDTILQAGWGVAHAEGNDCVFLGAGVAAYEVNIEDTVRFELNLPDGVVTTSEFISYPAAKTTITDAGATYTANANAVKNGVIVPAFGPAKDKYTLAGYATTENATTGTALGGTYMGTEAVTFYPYYEETPANDAEAVELGNVAKTDVNGDGTVEYHKTVAAAIAALPAGTQLDGMSDADKAKHTITLIANVDASKWGGMINVSKALILDGNGKTAKSPDDAYTALDVYSADIVFKNVSKFDGKRLMRVWADVDDVDISVIDSNIEITGCQGFYLRSAAVAAADKTAGKYTKGYSATFTIDGSTLTTSDSTWDKNNASPIFIHYHGDCYDVNWTVNVNDTTLTHKSTVSSYNTVIAAHMSADLTINLTGNTVLNMQGKTTATPTLKQNFGIYVSNNYKGYDVNVNVADTVIFNADNVEGNTHQNQYIRLPDGAVLVNNGKYFATVNALANGVILPEMTAAEGKTFLGWSNGSALIKADTAYTATVDGKVEFTPVFFDTADFAMEYGASLRTQKGSGIRFRTNVSAELKALLGNNVSFGTLISRVTNVGPTLETAAEDLVVIARTQWANDEETLYSAALINIPDTAKAYDLKMAGRGYMTVTYANGTETFYTDYTEEANARSIREIATNLLAKHNATEGEDASFELDAATLALVNTIIATM